MPECRARGEQHRRHHDEWNGELLLVRVQTRSDEQPDLREDDRRRQDQSGHQADLDHQHERFGRLGVDQLLAGRQHLLHRQHDEGEDAVDEGVGEREPDADGDQRIDDASPELIEMLQK